MNRAWNAGQKEPPTEQLQKNGVIPSIWTKMVYTGNGRYVRSTHFTINKDFTDKQGIQKESTLLLWSDIASLYTLLEMAKIRMNNLPQGIIVDEGIQRIP